MNANLLCFFDIYFREEPKIVPKPEGLFSIGEIAAVCGVSIDTLRFYETKALISPAHRPRIRLPILQPRKSAPAAQFWG